METLYVLKLGLKYISSTQGIQNVSDDVDDAVIFHGLWIAERHNKRLGYVCTAHPLEEEL